jgi:glycosyltransferase involved in cell wall biosynthesis
MRILICAYAAPLPPVNDGFRVQLTSLWKELDARHDVHVVAFRWPDQREPGEAGDSMTLVPSPVGPTGIRRLVAQARDLARRRPLQTYATALPLREPLRAEIERFRPDVIHVSADSLATLGADLALERTVLATFDAQFLNQQARMRTASGLRRLIRKVNAANFARFEAREYERFDRVTVVSQEDADVLKRLNPALRISFIPNGVDADAYGAPPDSVREPGLILFTGHMGFSTNISAAEFLAREILPMVQRARKDARLAIVGREADARVWALALLPGVEVVGEVPEMLPWLSRGSAYACPMIAGTGVKNKLLEAMANGLPCVATPLALRGTVAEPGRDVLVAQGKEEFANRLLDVLADPGLATKLGNNGHDYVRREHDWSAVAGAYEGLYRDVIAEHGPRDDSAVRV